MASQRETDDRSLLNELLDYDGEGRAGRLWDKEVSFLENLADWSGSFTPKQQGWLYKIYARIFGD